MVLFCSNRFMYFFTSFLPFTSMYYPFQARRCKLKGYKRFLNMSTRRTLTLGCRFPIVNWPPKKFTVSAPYKRVSMRTCCRSTDETHHPIPQQVSWQRIPLKLAGRTFWIYNAKIPLKKQKENWAKKFYFWAFIFWATEVIFLIQWLVRVGFVLFLLSLLLFLLFSFFSNQVVRKEVSWGKGAAKIFERGIASWLQPC